MLNSKHECWIVNLNFGGDITPYRRGRQVVFVKPDSPGKTVQANGITYEEATKHVYDVLMPEYTRELMKIYIKYLRLLKGLQRHSSTHRKIMENYKTFKRGGRLRWRWKYWCCCKSKEIYFATYVDARRRYG